MQNVNVIIQTIKSSINIVKKNPVILLASLTVTILDDLFSTDYSAFKTLSTSSSAEKIDSVLRSFLTINNLIGFLIIFVAGFIFYNILYQLFVHKHINYKRTITSTLFHNNMYWYTLSFISLMVVLLLISGIFTTLLYVINMIIPMVLMTQIYVIIGFTFLLLMLSYPFVSIALRLAVAEISFKRKWELYFKLLKPSYYIPSLKFYWIKSLLEIPVLGMIGLIAYLNMHFAIEFVLYVVIFSLVVSIGRTASFDFFLSLYNKDLNR